MDKPKHTTDGEPPVVGHWDAPAPKPINPKTGQHGAYWVLPEEERAKGFVRPVRRSYRHVGPPPPANLRDLTPEELERHSRWGYIKFEAYGEDRAPLTGRFWTQTGLDSIGGCGALTTMSADLAETYARRPDYYGKTFCCNCGDHLPVGEKGEFVWDGTDERVGA